MAYIGPGISETEMAKGAAALTDILSQGDVLKERKAMADIAETQAESAQMRLSAEKKYMAAEEKIPQRDIGQIYGQSSEGDPALISGQNVYGFLQLSQELQQRKTALVQEEKNARLLAPEDRHFADANIDRMQKEVDDLQSKLLKETETHAGQRFSILDSVHDDASLQGARDYFAREVGEVADKAIADGRMSPDNKERYINDKVNAFLPKRYDAEGKIMIQSQKNGMLSIQQQAQLRAQDAAAKRADAAMVKAEADAKRQYNLTLKAIKSHDKDQIANSIKLTNDQLVSAQRQVKEFEDKAQQYEADARSSLDKDQQSRDQQIADDYRTRATELQKEVKPLEDTMKALGEEILPENVKKKLANEDLLERLKELNVPYEPDKYEYRVDANGKVQRKKK